MEHVIVAVIVCSVSNIGDLTLYIPLVESYLIKTFNLFVNQIVCATLFP